MLSGMLDCWHDTGLMLGLSISSPDKLFSRWPKQSERGFTRENGFTPVLSSPILDLGLNITLLLMFSWREAASFMFLLNTTCEHSSAGCKVCGSLDLITGWPLFGSNNLNQNISCSCRSDLHSQEESWTIAVDRTVFGSAGFLACLVWIAVLRSSHSIPTGLRSGPWAAPKGVFTSVEAILLLTCFYALGCCLVASTVLASVGGQTIFGFLANCPNKLKN